MPSLFATASTIALITASAYCQQPPTTSPGDVINELRSMVAADQLERTPPNQLNPRNDELRLKRVLELLANNKLTSPESQECAAIILIHTQLFICQNLLKSESTHNYYLAHLLAKSAAQNGRVSARRLAANALDRFLVFSGKPQKYGTQTILDLKTQKIVLAPIDPSTTDSERAEWGVEPLSQILSNQPSTTP